MALLLVNLKWQQDLTRPFAAIPCEKADNISHSSI